MNHAKKRIRNFNLMLFSISCQLFFTSFLPLFGKGLGTLAKSVSAQEEFTLCKMMVLLRHRVLAVNMMVNAINL